MLSIKAGKRRQGGQKKQWIDDIVQWGERDLVEMVRQAENRKGYRCLVQFMKSPTLVHRARQADDVCRPMRTTCLVRRSCFSFRYSYR